MMDASKEISLKEIDIADKTTTDNFMIKKYLLLVIFGLLSPALIGQETTTNGYFSRLKASLSHEKKELKKFFNNPLDCDKKHRFIGSLISSTVICVPSICLIRLLFYISGNHERQEKRLQEAQAIQINNMYARQFNQNIQTFKNLENKYLNQKNALALHTYCVGSEKNKRDERLKKAEDYYQKIPSTFKTPTNTNKDAYMLLTDAIDTLQNALLVLEGKPAMLDVYNEDYESGTSDTLQTWWAEKHKQKWQQAREEES